MLHLNDVSLRVGGHLLLEGATVHVPAGQRVGLVGRNGSGKTSLLRLIQGETQPDAGTLRLRKGARIGRPSAAARPAVARRLPGIAAEIDAGTLSKRQAAKRLGVGAPTLDRLLATAGAATKGEGG